MKLVRYICNIIFIIILALFTIGYTSKSIINLNATVKIILPTGPDGKSLSNDINSNFTYSMYLDKIVDISNSDNTTINYNEINSTLGTITKLVKYIFIAVSACIGLIIILSSIGLKKISYIPLAISQLVMIMTSLFMIIIYSTHYLTNIIKNYISDQSINGIKININNLIVNYDTGCIFIFVSTALLIVINFIYVFLG